MNNDIKDVLNALDMDIVGRYENHFYVIDLDDSDAFASAYTKLCDNAINTEYPSLGTNSTNNTTNITSYFEIDVNNVTYQIFLIGNFDEDKYYLKIGEAKA